MLAIVNPNCTWEAASSMFLGTLFTEKVRLHSVMEQGRRCSKFDIGLSHLNLVPVFFQSAARDARASFCEAKPPISMCHISCNSRVNWVR